MAGRELPPSIPAPVGLGGVLGTRWTRISPSQVPPVPAGQPAAPCLPHQLLHSAGAAGHGPARGHRAVPDPHGVSPQGGRAGEASCRVESPQQPHEAAHVDGGLLCASRAGQPPAPGKLGASPRGFPPAPPAKSSPCSSQEARPGPQSSPSSGSSGPPVATAAGCCSERQVCLSQGWAQAWLALPRELAGAGEAGLSFGCAQGERERASPTKGSHFLLEPVRTSRWGGSCRWGAPPGLDAGPAGLPAARGHPQTAPSLGSLPLSEASGPLVSVGQWEGEWSDQGPGPSVTPMLTWQWE